MENDFRVDGRVAIITAGAAGIGRAITERWAALGGSAMIVDWDEDAAESLRDQVAAAGCQAEFLALDIKDPDAVATIVPRTVERFGTLHALFNVAGTNIFHNVEESSEADWELILDTNVRSVERCSKPAIPVMRAGGGGAIVNVASIMGMIAGTRDAAYSASKGAVIQLTRSMAVDFARDQIRVNAICPGFTLTPRARGYLERIPGAAESLGRVAPMGRMATPEEIAAPAVFLASDAAAFITGIFLPIDGGTTAGNTSFPVPGA